MKGSLTLVSAAIALAAIAGCEKMAKAPKGKAQAPKEQPQEVEIAEIFTLAPKTEASETISVEEIKKFLADPKNHEPIVPKVPLGLSPLAELVPEDNPLTRAKVELGRMLYFDPRLSLDETVSCASCHRPEVGWAEETPVSSGIKGQKGGRSAPTVMNRAFGTTQFWDGRAATMEEQALGPIQNPIEMGFNLPDLVKRLNDNEGYRLMFEKVFGEVNEENVADAIAAFERCVVVGGAPHDYHDQAKNALQLSADDIEDLEPDEKEHVERVLAEYQEHKLSDAALRGKELYFGKAQCSLCHVGVNLSDELFYNIGVGMDAEKPDIGRHEVTKVEADTGAFKTPGLRNIKLTAPYMHDGSQKTLMEVVEYYDKGGHPNPQLHQRIKKLNLTEDEKKDLVVFLEEGLTSPPPNIPRPRLP